MSAGKDLLAELDPADVRAAADLQRQLAAAEIDLADLPRVAGTTRRDLLKAAGLAGAAGLTGAGGVTVATQEARAADTSAGNIGTAGGPLDVYIDELKDPGGDVVVDVDDTGTLAWQRAVSFPSAQVGGNEVPGVGASSAASPGFDTWTKVSETRPAQVVVEVNVQTDGTTNAMVTFEVDESGGTTTNYAPVVSFVDSSAGAGVDNNGSLAILLPAGAQYRVANVVDPNGSNLITELREFTL